MFFLLIWTSSKFLWPFCAYAWYTCICIFLLWRSDPFYILCHTSILNLMICFLLLSAYLFFILSHGIKCNFHYATCQQCHGYRILSTFYATHQHWIFWSVPCCFLSLFILLHGIKYNFHQLKIHLLLLVGSTGIIYSWNLSGLSSNDVNSYFFRWLLACQG